jgi:hypothetical protein
MAAALETLQDIYTRKVGGEQYSYELSYSTGPRVEWAAKVFQDGALKGTPSGVVSDNTLSGAALRQSVITLVEIAIENMLGIAE